MEIKTTTARPSRDETWTQVIHNDADLADAMEALIDAYRARRYSDEGKSRFGIVPVDITITF